MYNWSTSCSTSPLNALHVKRNKLLLLFKFGTQGYKLSVTITRMNCYKNNNSNLSSSPEYGQKLLGSQNFCFGISNVFEKR